jgi:hypothetical protein
MAAGDGWMSGCEKIGVEKGTTRFIARWIIKIK